MVTPGNEEEQPEEPGLVPIGGSLGKYEIRKKLGQGGMGTVYLAFDPMIEREVAIKVLPPEVAVRPKALERFLSEARATGKLNHVNVVAIYDIATHDDLFYIVMELVQGGSVGDFMERCGNVDWKEACRIAAEASEGLAAAHAAGLIHRDIKPDNLMLTDEGVVKVVDFGLAKLVETATQSEFGLTKAGQILGTPHYMSPEQYQSQSLDARSDVYSMGGTFHTLLTGDPPYPGCASLMHLMSAHVQSPPPDPTSSNSGIPAACKDVVAKAMAKDVAQRYRDAGELAAAIREILASTDDTAAQTFRQLQSVVIVEPSKMQAMMLERACKNEGASNVFACGNVADAVERCMSEPPDLLVTAMQLPDAKGSELLRNLSGEESLSDAVFVLNSSDSSIDQLLEFDRPGPLAVVSKKTKAEQLLRAIHACTFLNMEAVAVEPAAEGATLRYGLVCDASNLPDSIAALIRKMNLLDVQITTFDQLAVGKGISGEVDLLMSLRTAGDAANDARVYTDLLTRAQVDAKARAAVQVDGQRVVLRAFQFGEFAALSRGPLDEGRMTRLIQLCSNS